MRVLFGWEFGAGLGHLTRFRPIGDKLIEQGHEVFVALQELDKASPFLDATSGRSKAGYHLLQAPKWNLPTDPRARQVPTESFADVLKLIGYGEPGALRNRLTAWEDLIETVQPDVVLGDFAPTLGLACRGRRKFICIGNGYTIPPQGRALPPIRPWQEALQQFSLDHEQELLANLNLVLEERGEARVEYLADTLHGDETFIFTLSLVDPYAKYRSEPTLAPFNLPSNIQPKPFEEREEGRVFLYLPRTHNNARSAFDGLVKAGVRGEAYFSDMPRKLVEGLSKPGGVVHTEPQDFAELLPSVRLVVHHGGLSTAVAALMAGTPQMILPWNLEHLVTARALETAAEAAIVPGNKMNKDWIAKGIKTLVNEGKRSRKALEVASTLPKGNPEVGIDLVVGAILASG